jgi:glycosyltransferase involved in cell wall biosynthesis
MSEHNSIAAPLEPAGKVNVLVLIGSYLPGYKGGGPIRSVSNLASALGNEVHFKVVTLDRDLGDESPYPGVVVNQWVRLGNADVMYLRPGLRCALGIFEILRSVDANTVVYLNSFFSRSFSMLAMLMRWLGLCRPKCLVLAPRGEFSLGALGIKRTRKQLYIRIVQQFGLYRGLIWHASSDFEAADISRQFTLAMNVHVAAVIPTLKESNGKKISQVVIAPDLRVPSVQVALESRGKKPGQLRVVFVSRIARKKNLAGALRMLTGLSGDVKFDIYGPVEDAAYWEECQGLIAALPQGIRARYCGQVEHEKTARVFAEHDLLLFPTLGENFGHVICEALASGCPVLLSDQTPWRNLQAIGVGWDVPLSDTERFRAVLQQCVDGDIEWQAALSTRAKNYAEKMSSDPRVVDASRKLFEKAVAWPKQAAQRGAAGNISV